MNEVTIFTDITTEQALQQIEADSKKYNSDIVADMHNDDDRRIIKKEASEIADMRKAVERARIDKKKVYGKQVDNEAAIIDGRLAKANEPFDVLIGNYNAERKLILDRENARKKAIEDQAAIDSDYEIAELLMAKYFDDKAKAEQQRIAYEETLKRQAAEDAEKTAKLKEAQALIKAEADKKAAVQAEIDRQQKVIDDDLAEKARLAANQEHVSAVHRNMKAVYIAAGFPDELAEVAVKLLVKNKVPNTTFNY